MPTVQVVLNWS